MLVDERTRKAALVDFPFRDNSDIRLRTVDFDIHALPKTAAGLRALATTSDLDTAIFPRLALPFGVVQE